EELPLLERPSDAANPELHVTADLLRYLTSYDHVRDGEPTAGLEHPVGLPQNLALVPREIDDAVGDDDVHRVVGEWNGLDLSLEKLDVGRSRLPSVLPRQGEHLVGHVEPIGLAGRADTLGREQHIDPAA